MAGPERARVSDIFTKSSTCRSYLETFQRWLARLESQILARTCSRPLHVFIVVHTFRYQVTTHQETLEPRYFRLRLGLNLLLVNSDRARFLGRRVVYVFCCLIVLTKLQLLQAADLTRQTQIRAHGVRPSPELVKKMYSSTRR